MIEKNLVILHVVNGIHIYTHSNTNTSIINRILVRISILQISRKK